MRVVVLTADYPPNRWSGIGTAVENQARALADLGVDVDVLVAGDPELYEASRRDRSVTSDVTPSAGDAERLRLWRLGRERFPLDWRGLDVIHVHSLALTELALELRRRTRCSLVYTAHSLVRLELEPGPMASFWSAVQDALMSACDHVVFLSESDRMAALERLPALARCSSVIPNGVPAPPARRAEPPMDGPVVFAGRFARSKGIDVFAAMVPRLFERGRCRFVLAGGHADATGDGVMRELRAAYSEVCQVREWLPREQLDDLFQRAALVIVPSIYEPFGLVALEAMRVGAPVLAAANGGLTEVVRADSGGRLVYSRDPNAWSTQALELLEDAATSRALRRRGPKYVRRNFDPRRLAQRLLDEAYAA